jgi:DnaJ-domain-containing protein 1
VPSEEDIARGAVLQPRAAEDGGPWTRLLCPGCGAEGALEAVPGSGPLLAPPEAVGAGVPAVAALLEGRRARDVRRRAAEWTLRYGGAVAGIRADRLRGAAPPPHPAPPPRTRHGDRRGPAAPPPPKPRAAVRAPAGLPASPAEARAVLGVGDGATRKEIDAAYRKASRKCHPDLVAHLDEDFQRLAHEKFLRLQRARELLDG